MDTAAPQPLFMSVIRSSVHTPNHGQVGGRVSLRKYEYVKVLMVGEEEAAAENGNFAES